MTDNEIIYAIADGKVQWTVNDAGDGYDYTVEGEHEEDSLTPSRSAHEAIALAVEAGLAYRNLGHADDLFAMAPNGKFRRPFYGPIVLTFDGVDAHNLSLDTQGV